MSDEFVVNLSVPYHSQDDQDDHDSPNTCGPTAVAMVMDLLGEAHSGNEVFVKTGAGQGVITVQQILNAIQSFGFKCEYKTGLQFSDLQELLQEGLPPIVLVKAKYLTSREDQGYNNGHFLVLDGYRADGVTVNDPDFYGTLRPQGDHHFYTMSEFMNAWSNCHEDSNPDCSAIVIYPKTNIYKGIDLSNISSVKVCVDTWSDVAHGSYVSRQNVDLICSNLSLPAGSSVDDINKAIVLLKNKPPTVVTVPGVVITPIPTTEVPTSPLPSTETPSTPSTVVPSEGNGVSIVSPSPSLVQSVLAFFSWFFSGSKKGGN